MSQLCVRFTEFPRLCSYLVRLSPYNGRQRDASSWKLCTVRSVHTQAVRELDASPVEPNPGTCRTARSIPVTRALALLEHIYRHGKSVSLTWYHADLHKIEFRLAARSVQAVDGGLKRFMGAETWRPLTAPYLEGIVSVGLALSNTVKDPAGTHSSDRTTPFLHIVAGGKCLLASAIHETCSRAGSVAAVWQTASHRSYRPSLPITLRRRLAGISAFPVSASAFQTTRRPCDMTEDDVGLRRCHCQRKGFSVLLIRPTSRGQVRLLMAAATRDCCNRSLADFSRRLSTSGACLDTAMAPGGAPGRFISVTDWNIESLVKRASIRYRFRQSPSRCLRQIVFRIGPLPRNWEPTRGEPARLFAV
jgi:hypothetical protein